MPKSLRIALFSLVLAGWLAPLPALAQSILDVDERSVETVGVEKLVMEGFDKVKWKRPLTSRLSLQRNLWHLHRGPRPYDDLLGFSYEAELEHERMVRIGLSAGNAFVEHLNEAILGPPDPDLVRRLASVERRIEDLDEEIDSISRTIHSTRERIEELKSRAFWWILHGLEVLGLENSVEDWQEESDDLTDDLDDEREVRDELDVAIRPFWPRFENTLKLKTNRYGTRLKLKGVLRVVARHRVTGDTIEGRYKIDHRAKISD